MINGAASSIRNPHWQHCSAITAISFALIIAMLMPLSVHAKTIITNACISGFASDLEFRALRQNSRYLREITDQDLDRLADYGRRPGLEVNRLFERFESLVDFADHRMALSLNHDNLISLAANTYRTPIAEVLNYFHVLLTQTRPKLPGANQDRVVKVPHRIIARLTQFAIEKGESPTAVAAEYNDRFNSVVTTTAAEKSAARSIGEQGSFETALLLRKPPVDEALALTLGEVAN